MTPIQPKWVKLPDDTEYCVPPPSPIIVSTPHPLDEFIEKPEQKVWGYYHKELTCVHTSRTYRCDSCEQVFEVFEDDEITEDQSEEISIVCEKCFKEIKELERAVKK